MLQRYTNINFTDKQLADTPKLYDIIYLNGIWENVAKYIPDTEKDFMWNNILEVAKRVTEYYSSALGIVRALGENYEGTSFDL
jgi:hypothetical protein